MSPERTQSGSRSRPSGTVTANFEATQGLAETVRTTLGPKGLDKMLVSADGRVVVTNDGASILDRLDIDHPAAKLVVDVARQQERNAGDGTTSAVLLADQLLQRARSIIERGVHPTQIIRGYELAATRAEAVLSDCVLAADPGDDDELRDIAETVVTGKWDADGTAFLADKAVDAVRAIQRDGRVGFERITRKTFPGGSFYDSAVVEGLVIDLDESSADVVSPETGVVQQSRTPSIALIDEELSIDKADGIGAVDLETYEEYTELQAYETEVYEEYVTAIVESGADVVFCQQSIDDPVRYQLAEHGILAIERTRRDELRKLARATGAHPVVTDSLTPASLGRASDFERRRVGATPIVVVSGYDQFDHISLLFRGGTAHVAEETKRKLDDCLSVLKLAIEDQSLVPGGGASETAVSTSLRTAATEYSGREQLAVESFADALEIVPRTLAETAGLDPADTLIALRNAHAGDADTIGVDVMGRQTADMAAMGVLEPYHIKKQMLLGAVDAATMLLRIDDRIETGDAGGEHSADEHSHETNAQGLVESTDSYPWAVGHSMGHDH